jgi:hypothetical protein
VLSEFRTRCAGVTGLSADLTIIDQFSARVTSEDQLPAVSTMNYPLLIVQVANAGKASRKRRYHTEAHTDLSRSLTFRRLRSPPVMLLLRTEVTYHFLPEQFHELAASRTATDCQLPPRVFHPRLTIMKCVSGVVYHLKAVFDLAH